MSLSGTQNFTWSWFSMLLTVNRCWGVVLSPGIFSASVEKYMCLQWSFHHVSLVRLWKCDSLLALCSPLFFSFKAKQKDLEESTLHTLAVTMGLSSNPATAVSSHRETPVLALKYSYPIFSCVLLPGCAVPGPQARLKPKVTIYPVLCLNEHFTLRGNIPESLIFSSKSADK